METGPAGVSPLFCSGSIFPVGSAPIRRAGGEDATPVVGPRHDCDAQSARVRDGPEQPRSPIFHSPILPTQRGHAHGSRVCREQRHTKRLRADAAGEQERAAQSDAARHVLELPAGRAQPLGPRRLLCVELAHENSEPRQPARRQPAIAAFARPGRRTQSAGQRHGHADAGSERREQKLRCEYSLERRGRHVPLQLPAGRTRSAQPQQGGACNRNGADAAAVWRRRQQRQERPRGGQPNRLSAPSARAGCGLNLEGLPASWIRPCALRWLL